MQIKEIAAKTLYAEVGNAQSLNIEQARQYINYADALINKYVGDSTIPSSIMLLSLVAVARDLHTASLAPGGIYTPFGDGGAVRLARDPMRAAYPLLTPFIGGGFA